MKILNKLAFIAAISSTVMACKKDLDRSPLTSISDSQYWKTANDLQLYCNAYYAFFPSYTGFGSIGNFTDDADQGSDNMIAETQNTRLNGETVVPVTNANTGWTWTQLKSFNYFLTHYQTVQASPEIIKPYIGETLFFRARFYFDKLQNYGSVPWVNKPVLNLNDPILFEGRLPRNIVADSIIQDLDRAITLLPTKASAKAGRINREIAQLLLSRVALYEGTWEKYHAGSPFAAPNADPTKYLQKAADAAQAIIASNAYSLDNVGVANGYYTLFNNTDYGQSKEVMLWRRYERGVITHNWHRYSTAGAGRGITKSLVDDYLCTDGKPTAGNALYQGDNTLLDVVKNRDPRLSQIMYVNDGNHIITTNQPNTANTIFTVPAMLGGGTGSNTTGYQLYKGHNPDYYQQNAGEVGTTGLILFRYAEALLNLAEAKAELGTLTQTDVDNTINKLRSRVNMPNLVLASITADPNWKFPALSATINEVRRERRVELACEGFRHDDIYRWAAADELILGWKPKGAKKAQFVGTTIPAATLAKYPADANGYIEWYQANSAMATGYKFSVQRDYLSPIPTNELVLAPALKPQNPGW